MYLIYGSPEIHPVSPRVSKKGNLCGRIGNRMSVCCRRDRNKNNRVAVKPLKAPPAKVEPKASLFTRLFKWKRKTKIPPKPTAVAAAKHPKKSIMSKLNCCKKKPVKRSMRLNAANKGRFWRKVFCLDLACCSKLKRNTNQEKKKEKRSSSFVGFQNVEPSLVEHASVMKGAIPVLPICLAWFCLFLNIFLPGIGTIMSGFLCLCFGQPRFTTTDSAVARFGSFCVNIIVGISQIFTIIFCLVGWGWSIWWGVMMVRLSRKNRRIKAAEKASGAPTPVAVNQNHDLEAGGH